MRLTQRALPAGNYRNGKLPRERLAKVVADTNAAIQRGFDVPLIDFHEDLDNLDPRSALRTCGSVQRVFVDNDGWLNYELEATDAEAARKLNDGSIKFTSPEFKFNYEAETLGPLGDIVRHVALTNKPRNPIQGKFQPLPAGVARFSIEDYMADDNDTPDDAADQAEPADTAPPEKPDINPDMPPSTDATKKMSAVIAGLAELGVVLPSDFSFTSDGAIDVLLTGLNTAVKSKQEADTPTPVDDQPQVNDSSAMQFSEDEIAAQPAAVQKVIRQNLELQRKVLRFSEERDTASRELAIEKASRRQVPPAIKEAIVARMKTMRFSDESEPSLWTGTEVLDLVERSLPPQVKEMMRFSSGEPDSVDVPSPDADKPAASDPKAVNAWWDKEIGRKPKP